MIRNLSLASIGLLQAAGLAIYVIIVSKILQYGEVFFGSTNNQIGMMAFFLLLFVTSALVSGLVTLGYPALLFFEGRRKQALELVLWSAIWLIGFLIIFVGLI